MKFISTRGQDKVDSASMAIVKGLASDGGLFVPQTFPNAFCDIDKILNMDYAECASHIIGKFLDEFDKEGLLTACKNAYAKFEEEIPAPIVKLDEGYFVMELFRGPTLAFKDIALTLLPYLLRQSADNVGALEEILILVATSGDTGKAALAGFADQKGIKINVFYPSEGVSDMQKLQMCTQEGNNVNVVGVKGNFDDCQTAVKNIFADEKIQKELKDEGVILSSANSINFGRLVPQIVYYFSAYADLVNSNQIKVGDKVNFTVPTGNFGNILAGYYAKQMGLPIAKLLCASNSNNVLTEFFMTGSYDKNREFFKTVSPSMDILISSNLERLIFEISGRDATLTKERMDSLKKEGKYQLTEAEQEKLDNEYFASFADEEECFSVLADVFEEYGYLIDTHTAVAIKCFNDYLSFTGDQTPNVIVSTASPYKFPQSVLKAITGKNVSDAFKASNMLNLESAMPIPEQITELQSKTKRFTQVIDKKEAFESVKKFISK